MNDLQPIATLPTEQQLQDAKEIEEASPEEVKVAKRASLPSKYAKVDEEKEEGEEPAE